MADVQNGNAPIFAGNYNNSGNCGLLYANNNSWTSSNNNCSARASFLRLWFRNKRTLRQWKHQQSRDYTATNKNRHSVYLEEKAKFSAERKQKNEKNKNKTR